MADFPGFRECPLCEGHGQLSAADMSTWEAMEKSSDEEDRLRDANELLRERVEGLEQAVKLVTQGKLVPIYTAQLALLKRCAEELAWCESHWGSDYSQLRAEIDAVANPTSAHSASTNEEKS